MMKKTIKNTLLQKALGVRLASGNRTQFDPETFDLAMAYAEGRITSGQAAQALGVRPVNATTHLGRALLAAVKEGALVRSAR